MNYNTELFNLAKQEAIENVISYWDTEETAPEIYDRIIALDDDDELPEDISPLFVYEDECIKGFKSVLTEFSLSVLRIADEVKALVLKEQGELK
jgi:hypothetical protein